MLAVGMPKEDGIIHSNGELENGGKSFGDIGNFAEDDIAAEVD